MFDSVVEAAGAGDVTIPFESVFVVVEVVVVRVVSVQPATSASMARQSSFISDPPSYCFSIVSGGETNEDDFDFVFPPLR